MKAAKIVKEEKKNRDKLSLFENATMNETVTLVTIRWPDSFNTVFQCFRCRCVCAWWYIWLLTSLLFINKIQRNEMKWTAATTTKNNNINAPTGSQFENFSILKIVFSELIARLRADGYRVAHMHTNCVPIEPTGYRFSFIGVYFVSCLRSMLLFVFG